MTANAYNELPLLEQERDFLHQYGFNETAFMRLKSLLAAENFPPENNRLDATFAPPAESDLTPWPTDTHIESLGRDAIEAGKVGVAILNGGMATRFGGVVKGTVDVFDGRSFLELKMHDLKQWKGRIPVFLMNSFATHTDTIEHFKNNQMFDLNVRDIHFLIQKISLRLTPHGDLFRGRDKAPSFYAPGHGDVFEVLAESEAFRCEQESGLQYLLISNVDNLAANLSAKVIGAHIYKKQKLTVEVAPRNEGDKGGAPVSVNGRVEIVEGFRFPPDFDHESLSVFNTNTFIANIDAIKADYPLDWFRADKVVDGEDAIQFERLMGQITSFIAATYLIVPREGNEGRFMPIKTPKDLRRLESILRERFS